MRKTAGALIYVILVLAGFYLLLIAIGVNIPRFDVALLNPWAAPGPRLSFQPRAVDFGSINQLAGGHRTITLQNSGNETVKLSMVRASSAALTLGLGQRDIAPASKVDLDLFLKPLGLHGPQQFTVSFVTNEAQDKQKSVPVKAYVDHTIPRRPGLRMEQLIFDASCRGCHLEPGLGKQGAALFNAVCADCHGRRGGGKHGELSLTKCAGCHRGKQKKSGPHLVRGPSERRMADHLRARIISGRSGTAMPAWGRTAGGYLSRGQVDSLVKVIIDWQKTEAATR